MTLTDSPPRSRGAAFLSHPLFLCAACAFALLGIGDRYPLSHFPMYSNLSSLDDSSADMLLVTNEKDEPLPMSKLFNTGSAQGKKRFESVLKDLGGTREYEDATPEQRKAAGEKFLAILWENRDAGDVAKWKPQALRLKMRTLSMRKSVFSDETHLLAEMTVPAAGVEGGAK